ncbi:SIR2 family protein [Leifsonia sp. L25]|uniref:SIR2 family protein n=1 Tax=Actinomycetes TaxID=1760 RepID=UPI003D69D79B
MTSKVDLPEEVVEAHANGTLVFFVGAGASAGAPSSLPTFENLARALAKRASHRFSKRGGFDFFIGSLESLPGGFNAHQHAKELISDPKSRFSPLHRAIVDLANASGTFRVVTTNYDDHLASAARDAAMPIGDTWFAPALPLGRSFEGLVHLHGSVTRSEMDMILTDRDFGRAYMTDAWAARFLLPMFDRFTVVFVGYSHDDVIMRYLALGLPSRDEGSPNTRFAFTSAPDDTKWEYLGIVPIEYPVVGRDHGALVSAFEAWGDRARMGQLEHRARMRDIVTAGPKLTPVERDYLMGRLRTTQGAQEFAQATTEAQLDMRVSWLRWIEGHESFSALFRSGALTDASAVLGTWFCQMFIASPELHGAALQTVQRVGQTFSDNLFRGSAWTADELAKLDADAGRRWKSFIATSIGGQSSPGALEHLLPYSSDGPSIDISVIRACLRPYLQLKRRWFLDDSDHPLALPDADVEWATDEHSLTAHIIKLVDNSPHGDSLVGVMLEDALASAYDLLEAFHGKREWDQFSSRRSSIAPHGQDSFRHPIDAVIDGLRAYADLASPIRPELPTRWWETNRPLFQRLAVVPRHVVNA